MDLWGGVCGKEKRIREGDLREGNSVEVMCDFIEVLAIEDILGTGVWFKGKLVWSSSCIS